MNCWPGCCPLAVYAFGNAPEPADQFYDCIRRNDLGMLQGLIKTAGVKTKDKHGTTPLHQAAANGSAESVRLLVAAGAEIDAANDFGATPLMWAITEPEKVRILVSAGANVNARSKMGRTPLYLAAANDGSSATVKLLLDRGAKPEDQALVMAAAAGDFASIRLLVEKGVNVNAADPAGRTPLMFAAGNGNLRAVEYLLTHGADVNAVSAEKSETVKNGPIALGNLTALMMAAPAAGPDVLKALLDAGAKVNALDVRKMNALMLAIASDHADARSVRLLLDRGADPALKDRDGQSALDWARKFNAPAILRELGLPRQKVETPRIIIPTAILGKLDPKPAAARSVELLQRGSASFFKEGGCGACHSANLTSMAVTAAAARHIPVQEEARAGELKGAQFFLGGLVQPLLQRGDPPVVDILMYAGFQLASENVQAGRDYRRDDPQHRRATERRRQLACRLGRAAANGRRRFLADRDGHPAASPLWRPRAQGGFRQARGARRRLARRRPAQDHRGPRYAVARPEVVRLQSPHLGAGCAAPHRPAARRRRLGPDRRPRQRRLRDRPGALRTA